jgi:predicted DsbA family dithiol-disulfide isomerase
MTTLEVPVHFDFASSICYVAYRAMQRLEGTLRDLEIALHWTPVDLTQITGVKRGEEIRADGRQNALRVAEELSVPVKMPPRWIDSRVANGAAILLEGSGREALLRERIFSEHFERGRTVEDGDQLARILADTRIPLPAEDFEEALDELDQRTQQAQLDLVTGVPTFMLGSWAFGGIQNETTMRLVLQRYASRARSGLLS